MMLEHIQLLQPRSAWLALKCFLYVLRHHNILIHSDTIATVKYLPAQMVQWYGGYVVQTVDTSSRVASAPRSGATDFRKVLPGTGGPRLSLVELDRLLTSWPSRCISTPFAEPRIKLFSSYPRFFPRDEFPKHESRSHTSLA